jgi:hypothetical protein
MMRLSYEGVDKARIAVGGRSMIDVCARAARRRF